MSPRSGEDAGGQPAPLGFLNLDKPAGWTSHDVVARVRRIVGLRQVGHAGALDPMATGVLVVGVGRATRLFEYLSDLRKVYRATIAFGIETDTWDAEGRITAEADAAHLTLEQLLPLLARFRGEIQQVPPMYSALKRDGQPLYRLARAGKTVAREPRSVHIERLDVLDWQPPRLSLRVACSAGVYIRSLAHDLGQAAATGAHLAALERAAIGHFALEDAVTPEALAEDWQRRLIAPRQALQRLPSVTLEAEAVRELGFGRAIALPQAGSHDLLCAYDAAQALVAVLAPDERPGWWRPLKVLAGAD